MRISRSLVFVPLALVVVDPAIAGTCSPTVVGPVNGTISSPLFSAPPPSLPDGGEAIEVNPLGRLARVDATSANAGALADPVLQDRMPEPASPMPATDVDFDGISATGFLPPDTNGDVGPNHYVQMVNSKIAIWDKSGTQLVAPVNINTIWSGAGGLCQSNNSGDPVVLYDQEADRWMVSQFAVPAFPGTSFAECIAISTTPDPTGTYYRYEFPWTTNLNDYPHFGIWPDGYYMAVNQFVGTTTAWAGGGAAAFERAAMLTGSPARMIRVDLANASPNGLNYGGQLPSDWEGTTAPPVGRGDLFMQWDDSTWIGDPTDTLRIWEFDVNWTTPTSSSFGLAGNCDPNHMVGTADADPDMCAFDRNCIPQPGTAVGLDAISDGRLMFRLPYRNFGTREVLLANHTVDATGTDTAGVRWYELRDFDTTASMYQQGTYSPDSENRWMGSIAMDQGGNVALGYSVSSSTVFPSIRYAGRLKGDTLGTMGQLEATMIAGAGSQTSSSNRWGDYSMMAVDPDGCSFWYTNEYVMTTAPGSWQTRIGSFRFPSCPVFADGFESGDTAAWSSSTP